MAKLYRIDYQTWGNVIEGGRSTRSHFARSSSEFPALKVTVDNYSESLYWGYGLMLTHNGWVTVYEFTTSKTDYTFKDIEKRVLRGLYTMLGLDQEEIKEFYDAQAEEANLNEEHRHQEFARR